MIEGKANTKINQKTVVFMMLITCLGIRWIPVAGSIGPAAIFFWLIGILLFFIPLSVIVIEMTLNYGDEDGGIYVWVKNALGHKHGFLTAWFYWTNNLFFYPSILTFMTVNFAYFIGEPGLAKNNHFVTIIVVASFWLSILINILGLKKVAIFSKFSSIINLVLITFLVGAGFTYLIYYGHSATNFTWESFLPHDTIINNLSNLAILMFALSGLELIPTIAKSVDNPRKTLPRGVIISSVVMILVYLLGTFAINFLLTPAALSNTAGLGDTFIKISSIFHIEFISKFLLLMLVIVEFSAIILWLIGPTIMFFECIDEGILPKSLQRLNKNNIPVNALILQGFIVTFIVLLTNYLPTVNTLYNVLVLIAAIIYFLPYLYLSVTYYKLRDQNQMKKMIVPTNLAKIIAVVTFLSVVFGIITSLFPSSDIKTTHDMIIYESELIAGPVIFILLGLYLYSKHKRLKK